MYETNSDFDREYHMDHNEMPKQRHNEHAGNIPDGNLTKQKQQHSACCRTGRSYELSCSILSLSFLEQEPDLYSLDDLKERY
ncbi:MAG: hypothetical protein JJU35_12770 [Balneolales bacterium]|nr:hypothetical protein [Balneolales bacterium]